MRCVNKGAAPAVYTNYKHARNDLATQIGWFCSYCEMPVKNMIEVEHIIPINNGGNEFDWDNFLLSCRYCNGVKNDRNVDRAGYLWPDQDNTFVAFQYDTLLQTIEPSSILPAPIRVMAVATIDLMGLDRAVHLPNQPTDADSRWIHRQLTWGVIEESYADWIVCPTPQMSRQIGRTALGHGFYSYWISKFHSIPQVLSEINLAFSNTYLPVANGAGGYVIRGTGRF